MTGNTISTDRIIQRRHVMIVTGPKPGCSAVTQIPILVIRSPHAIMKQVPGRGWNSESVSLLWGIIGFKYLHP